MGRALGYPAGLSPSSGSAPARSGSRSQPHPSSGRVQFHVDLGQDLVVAECKAEQGGGDDGHALDAQPAALDVGAMHADQGGDGDAEETAEGFGLPADGG